MGVVRHGAALRHPDESERESFTMVLFLSLFVIIQSLSGLIGVVIECPGIPNTIPNRFTYNECTDGSFACTYYSVGIGPNADNDSFVDFYLETSAKGYAAVGFSKNRKMPSTDVLGCGRDSNGALRVRDTWNPSDYNEDDPNQDGMCVHSITYENNMIKCSFSRFVAVVNAEHDLDLNDTHYLMFGYSDSQEYQKGFPHHSLYKLPRISDERVCVLVNSSVGGSHEGDWSGCLVRAHGILMTVAWPLLAAIGIFFSAWTKPAFPKGQWFQFHRALMVSSVVVSVIGLVLIFVAHKDNTIPGIVNFNCGQTVAHFIIGVIVTAFQLLNPILALLRCKPESKHRIIFNVFHGSVVGFVTEIFALVNVGLGIALFQSGCGTTWSMSYILWIYMGWIAFFVIFQVCLMFVLSLVSNDKTAVIAPLIMQFFLMFYRHLKKLTNPKSYKHLKDNSDIDELDFGDGMRWKDRNIRSKALGIFILVTVSVCAVLVVLLAVTDDGED